jgi:hypothetical protein
MHNWRQSPATVIASVVLLLIWAGIHLATFGASASTWQQTWGGWVLVLLFLTLLGNLVFVQIVDSTPAKKETDPDRNWRRRLWPVTPQRLLFWLALGYVLILLYLSIFAPNVDTKQQEIYRLRYYSAIGMYLIWS